MRKKAAARKSLPALISLCLCRQMVITAGEA
jgi:hypothetical protein